MSVKRGDILDAFTRCVGYDPIHAPHNPRIMEEAWVEHFDLHPGIDRDDLMTAVTDYYRTPNRPWPQPADISAIARAKKRDNADRAPLELNPAVVSDDRRQEHLDNIRKIIDKQAKNWSADRVE